MTTGLCEDNADKLARDYNAIILYIRVSGDGEQYKYLPATAIINAHGYHL